jgi:hypothetical protein
MVEAALQSDGQNPVRLQIIADSNHFFGQTGINQPVNRH